MKLKTYNIYFFNQVIEATRDETGQWIYRNPDPDGITTGAFEKWMIERYLGKRSQ